MSTHENRLCRLIVREHFGPIVEKVANVLIRKGRMPVGLIANFTALKPRQVRECLFVMIQHNLVVYAESQEKTRIVTYYEINRTELLHRSLIPKVLHSSQEWFERDGIMVAQSLLTHGKLTITDCINDILATTGVAPGRTTTQRTQSLTKAFTRMVKEKCLTAVRPSDSLTAADKDMAEEKRETDKMTLPPTPAELANIRKALGAQKQMDQRATIVGLKRRLDTTDDGYGEKRPKLLTDGDLVIVEEVETDVFFKINYDRYIIRWRNTQIANLYEARLNPTAKMIMQTILNLAEERMINCKEDLSNPVSIMLLLNNLPKDANLVDTLEFDPAELGSSNIKPKVHECLDKYVQILEDDLMAILKRDSGRSGQYVINLKTASKILKKNLIQGIVSARFGAPYVRIMNMLEDKGKLEEKQISRFSMMPVKDVILPRAADTLTDRLYHTMGNLRQRRFVERSKRAVLLNKCERTDVKADDSLLNAAEKKELETLNGVLEMLEIQELRIAEMVITLRDF
ncbi:RNA polymerase III subunit C82 [Mortierella sp. AD031]|nr:RNA polymerase III subunit C82 [Mortierella sp. AD031]